MLLEERDCVLKIKTAQLYDCKCEYLYSLFSSSEYPWNILPRISDCINNLISKGIPGFKEIEKGVLVGKDVSISTNATIIPPVIIGANSEVRPGAYIRGNVIISNNCVVGNSSELKNCILLDGVQVPHYNYVGDSVLGNKVHLGAGVICSNLKADGKNVIVRTDEIFDTGLRKVGAFLGDFADVGCGCVLNPGTFIGKNTSVYPLTSLRGIYPSDCIVKSADNIVKRKENV